MKQKLKLLFAYFRSFKTNSLQTVITLDRSNIEDWDGLFKTTEGKQIEPVGSIEKIIEELIEIYYYNKFLKYLNFDYDEYWNLSIDINPNEQKLLFTATCKEQTETPFEEDFEYRLLPLERQNNIDYLYSEFADGTKIDFKGWGRWGDGNITELDVEGRTLEVTGDVEITLWDITYYFMSEISSKYWNDGPGGDFDITIWGDDIFVKGINYEQEYEDTGMNIEVTPDNVLENEDDE